MPSKTTTSNTTTTSNELNLMTPESPTPTTSTNSALATTPKQEGGALTSLPPFLRDLFAQNEYKGKAKKYPKAQFINHHKNFGLWVDEEDVLRAGFSGFGAGQVATHKFGVGKDAQEKKGVLFKSIDFAIIANSPRYVEQFEDGKVRIKGILCDKFGQNFDNSLWEYHEENRLSQASRTTIRSYYLIVLFEKVEQEDGATEWVPIHEDPLCLSVKGCAASAFGEALQDVRNGIAKETGVMLDIESAFCHYLTHMELTAEERGGEQQSIVCVPEAGKYHTQLITTDEQNAIDWQSYVDVVREQNSNFASKFMRQLQAEVSSLEYFPVDGNSSVTPATSFTPNTAAGLGTVDAAYTLDDSSVPF